MRVALSFPRVTGRELVDLLWEWSWATWFMTCTFWGRRGLDRSSVCVSGKPFCWSLATRLPHVSMFKVRRLFGNGCQGRMMKGQVGMSHVLLCAFHLLYCWLCSWQLHKSAFVQITPRHTTIDYRRPCNCSDWSSCRLRRFHHPIWTVDGYGCHHRCQVNWSLPHLCWSYLACGQSEAFTWPEVSTRLNLYQTYCEPMSCRL